MNTREKDIVHKRIDEIKDACDWAGYQVSFCAMTPTKADLRDLDRVIEILNNLDLVQ